MVNAAHESIAVEHPGHLSQQFQVPHNYLGAALLLFAVLGKASMEPKGARVGPCVPCGSIPGSTALL